MWKTIRIDSNNNTIETENYKDAYLGLGGRSLIAQFLKDEVHPTCDPLGEEAKIIFCTGMFAGSGLACANRLSVGAKSPLTNGIKESNVGGSAAGALAGHNIRSIIIENIPEDDAAMKIILIQSNGTISLEDASSYQGMNNYEFVDTMQKNYGEKASVISIGRAGERLYKNSSLQVTEFGTNYPCRAAGRGGLGSVLGSKRIKGIVIQKSNEKNIIEYANKKQFMKIRKELNQSVIESSKTSSFSLVGTASTIDLVGPAGIIPWGDQVAALALYQQISDGTDLGNLLGQGTEEVGRHFNSKRIPTCKNQAMPGYDPRGSLGTGYTYATTSMGADHTAGITLGPDDPTDIEGAVATSNIMQHIFAMADSMTCMMAMATLGGQLDKVAELYNAMYGGNLNPDNLFAAADKTLLLEKEFNQKAGWKPEDNVIPEFFRNEALPSTGNKFDIPVELLSMIVKQ